jgi:hypothetical protein
VAAITGQIGFPHPEPVMRLDNALIVALLAEGRHTDGAIGDQESQLPAFTPGSVQFATRK